MKKEGDRARSLQGRMFQSVGSLSSILRSEQDRSLATSSEMIKSMGTLGSILTLTSRASSRVEVEVDILVYNIINQYYSES